MKNNLPTTPDALPSSLTTSSENKWYWQLAKAIYITLVFVFIFLAVSGLLVAGMSYRYLTQFTTAAEVSTSELQKVVSDGWNHELLQTQSKKTILVLGVDRVSNREGDPLLTDTLLLASLDLNSGSVSMLSLPRDLWLPEYQAKINSLYFYGQTRTPNRPEQFPKDVISELLKTPIHHTLVIELDQVAELIDLLGGVTITVEKGFTDPLFPRDDVDIRTITDPAILYKSVTFESGEQTMTGAQAIEYIRSRHSGDDQGTDDARSQRQQQVIVALLTKILSAESIKNPTLMGSLYRYYNVHFADSISEIELVALLKKGFANRNSLAFKLKKNTLSIQNATESGVLRHPPLSETQNQWSYAIVDQSQFELEVKQKLELN